MSDVDEMLHTEKSDALPVMQRFRIHFLVATALAAMLLALLAGLGLGRAKLALERKQFTEHAAQLAQKLASLENEHILFAQKESALKQSLEKQTARVAELELALEQTTQKTLKAEQVLASAPALLRAKETVTAPESKRYVRFGNVDCTVKAGSGEDDWKSCLQQGRPGRATAEGALTRNP